MCARFSLYATPAQIAELLELDVPEIRPQYNIAPTEMLLGAIERDGVREWREFRWGLIPSWAKDASVGTKMINARAETLLERPAFRNCFERRRCAIPASGFFEWTEATTAEPNPGVSLFEEFTVPRKAKAVKQPVFFRLRSGEPFAFAGLYDTWRNDAGERIRSCTLITTTPNDLVAPLHDRMPVLLRKGDLADWFERDPGSVLRPFPSNEMEGIPVSPAMNDPRNKAPLVLEALSG